MSTEAQLQALGGYLRGVREGMGMTIAEVEKVTEVAAEYIKRLEAAQVTFPAPHVLYALAGAYVVSYENLMELCGHLRPNPRQFPRELRAPEDWNPLPKP